MNLFKVPHLESGKTGFEPRLSGWLLWWLRGKKSTCNAGDFSLWISLSLFSGLHCPFHLN